MSLIDVVEEDQTNKRGKVLQGGAEDPFQAPISCKIYKGYKGRQ